MKILHLIDKLGIGGAQSIVKTLIRESEDKEFFLYSLRRTEEENFDKIFQSKSESKYNIRCLIEVKKLIEDKKIDLLHCHLVKSKILGLLLKYIFPELKLVFHEHGGSFQNAGIPFSAYKKILSLFKGKVDLFLAVSESTKLKRMENVKIPKEKIEVLRNFVDQEKFEPTHYSKIENRKKLGIKGDEFVLGYIGRLIPLKNLDKLIKAIRKLEQKLQNIKLVIVGRGSQEEYLKELVKKLNLSDKVIFLGYREDIPEIISAIDIGCLVSKYENLSMSLLEFISMNTPVLATEVGGNPEVIDQEIAEFVSAPKPEEIAEKVMKLKNKTINKQEFKIKKQNFGLNTYLEKLKQIYDFILDS